MTVTNLTLSLETGLQSAQATRIAQSANSFESKIVISRDERSVNAKSILGILALDLQPGDRISVTAIGDDEEAAACAIVKLFTTFT